SRSALQARAFDAALDGNFEQTQLLLQQLIDRFPSDLPSGVALAEAYGDEGRFEQANAILRGIVADDPNHPRAWFLLGKYAIQSGDSRRAIDDYLVRDLVIQNRLDNPQGRANVLNALGIAYGRLGQLSAARDNYEEAASIRREIGDRRGLATSLNNIARLEMMAGNFDAARNSLEQAQNVSLELGDQRGLAAFTNTLGTLEEEAGDHAAALTHFRDALKIREELGDRRALRESYNNVGFAYYMLGELDNARLYWERALTEARELGNRDGEMQGLQSLGLLHAARGEWAGANKAFLDALEISRELAYPEGEAVSLGYLGHTAGMQGRYEAALSQLGEAIAILEPVGDTRGMTEFALQLARIYEQLGMTEQLRGELQRIEAWLASTPNLEHSAELQRLHATLATTPAEYDARLQSAVDAANASGSVAAQMRTELTRAELALRSTDHEQALAVARRLAERARRDGFNPIALESYAVAAEALVAGQGAAAATSMVNQMLALLEKQLPYGGAYRIRALATDVLAANGAAEQSARQQKLAAEEINRVRGNLPKMALGVFDSQPLVNKLRNEALVDGD
ncbi:MAG: tetratricopeptide repeat protein, partial [Gammaproteobacteria bacterium]|nr:tetratricopeptide repeat protein [Gammaproteobacteria bacterium]